MSWLNKEHWDAYAKWEAQERQQLYDPKLRDKKLRQVAKDLHYDNWTWNSMGGFNEEEHERIEKYIKELEEHPKRPRWNDEDSEEE